MIRRPPRSTLFPLHDALPISEGLYLVRKPAEADQLMDFYARPGTIRVGFVWFRSTPCRRNPRAAASTCTIDRKSTRLNSSHSQISYAVFCLKKKKKKKN